EGVAAGSTEDYIAELPVFLTEHSQTDLLLLGTAESFLDIAVLLENTVFAKALRPLLIDAAESGSINIHECERRVYMLYYMSALKTADKIYKGKKRDELRRALLKSIDMVNIVTCFRMKAFNCGKDEIKAQLLPFRYRLNGESLDRLMQLDDVGRIAAELSSMGYHTASHAEFSCIENLTERISAEYLRRIIRMSQNSAAVYYSLIECLRTEQRNIKTIIEGIRYGISSSEILNMLVI
ncbi:MAG: V-type ATPase subunit, partial [Oscillospiraceae bacterium]